MKKIFLVSIFIFVISQIVFSQAVCPITTLKINKVGGQIIAKGKLATPIPNQKIELRNLDEKETFVSETITNENGEFEFSGIKKGKYAFNVDFVLNGSYLLKYRAIVKVKKSNSSKSKPSILILFGGNCWETEALTIK